VFFVPSSGHAGARAHHGESARVRGQRKEIQRQVKWTADFLEKNRENISRAKGRGGQADTAGFALWTLDVGGWKADETTGAVVEYLLQRNKDRDHWLPVSNRPPTEASALTTTYVVLRGLKKYASSVKDKELQGRLEKTRKCSKPPRPKIRKIVSSACGPGLAGANADMIQATAKELAKMQREDGGWSQIDKLDSDAYATDRSRGLASNRRPGDDGRRLSTRRQVPAQDAKDDGSWHVVSRSKPFQTTSKPVPTRERPVHFRRGLELGDRRTDARGENQIAACGLALAARTPLQPTSLRER